MAKDVSWVLSGFPGASEPARARNIIQVTGENGGPYAVYHDCRRLARDAATPAALVALVAGLNNAAIGQCPHFAVHSGVVAWKHGVAAFPAVSGGGKTTLTASLVQAGFDYVSDEALVLNDDGGVIPYPKPFALSRWSAELLGLPPGEVETLALASDLGGSDQSTTDPLTDVVIAEYAHDSVSMEPLPRSQIIAALISMSFNHYKDPERAFRLASKVGREARVWRLEYDDPLQAAELVAETLR